MTPHDSPRLIADIGGTWARFALETAPGRLEQVASLRCADHPDFHAAVSAYLARLPEPGAVRHAAVAIANPVEGDQVRMTNYHWEFSIEHMRARLGLDTLVVVNDFTALAMALPRLPAAQRRQVGGGAARERSVVGLIGAGTGLGVSGLIPADGGWVALGTEGGHTSFAPRDEREIGILRYALTQHDHVSFERLLSGSGLSLIHRALQHRDGLQPAPLPAPQITRLALEQGDARCLETLEVFCLMLGTAASNLAVTQGAFGGIFIGGGIVPRLGTWFDASPFRTRFEDKGRFSAYLRAIPTYVITAEHATLDGASAILAQQLRGLESAQGSAILGQIQRARANLSPAERRVADLVLAQPRSTLRRLLRDALPERLADRLTELLGIDGELARQSDKALRAAEERLSRWRFHPNGTEGFAKAEVTAGGISTAELSSKTMEAKKVPGLYVIGEAVDVTGWLGGYNFQWAWASGWAAAQAL